MALLETLGGIASGLGALGIGSKSKKVKTTDYQKAIVGQVRGAKQAGIHPIYAVGGGAASPAPQTISESPLSGIGNAMAAYSQSKVQASEETRLNRVTDAQVRQADAQARLLNKQADVVEQQAIDSALSRMGPKMNAQKDSEIADLYTPYRDNKTGETIWLVNPDTGLEAPEILGAAYWGQAKSYQSGLRPKKNTSRSRPAGGRPRHYLSR